MATGLEFKYAVVSDDVRREDNGKLIIIGAYGSSILVPSFPALMPLALTVSVDAPKHETLSVGIRILLNGERITEGEGQLEVNEGLGSLLMLPGLPIQVRGAGMLSFQIKLRDQLDTDWHTLRDLPIVLNPANASAQPS